MERHQWTEQEISILKDNYPSNGLLYCCNLLPNILKSKIIKKIKYLKLYKNTIIVCDGYKICSKCKEEKQIDNFSIRSKNGRKSHCKECISKKFQIDYYNNLEKFRNNGRKYQADYRKKNKEKYRNYQNKWKIKTYYTKYRYDINFKITQSLRSRINKLLKNKNKYYHSIELLGCSIYELKIHLKSKFQEGMTWENYGKYGWHIDHIRPCISFDLMNEEQQKLCFHYTNLQPLWAFDNLSKGGKYVIN